jgi:hypothetical protein
VSKSIASAQRCRSRRVAWCPTRICDTLANVGGKYDPDPPVLTPAEEWKLKRQHSERVRKAKRDQRGRFVGMEPKPVKAPRKS